ncbi:tumor-associated calcium signal transducer 2 [Coregonus clupeaformis]|uniref:tumor-associated calcium signal transducer 2 n=1 Tax=Coregonus clupeaformis TaxID=59861 RepID=UPI001BE08FD5|nr:tumor-associated calcium signal transducer 2 [Coregonus clupeaformis]
MKIWIALLLATFAVGVSAQDQCICDSFKWATCGGTPCQCSVTVGTGENQNLDCSKLIPKCFLMKAEMFRARHGLSTRTGGKPVDTAFVDNDGIYDPDCDANGAFRAKQCNNTEVCWCVNSAGVRRTDKGDKSLRCEKLVETYWVRLELKHKAVNNAVDAAKLQDAVATAIQNRYSFDKTLVKEVQYDPKARLIVVDVQKEKGDRKADLSRMAYYMEKDVKVLPLFKDQAKFEPSVDGQKLEMENILVYYVDEEAPTFTMKRLTGGVIAVIVVVMLAVAAGLLVLFLKRRREQRYSKAEPRELEAM